MFGKVCVYIGFVIWVIVLSGCVNPVVPPADVNQAPVASFQNGDFSLTGAGVTAANGIYEENGTLNDSVYYTQVGGSYKIFLKSYPASVPYPTGWYWAIDTSENSSTLGDLDYCMYNPGNDYWLPEDSLWFTISGAGLVGTITGIPFTVGADGGNEIDEVVTIEYAYTDSDGDMESGTSIKWFRCEAADSLVTDPTSLEVSSGSVDYTIQADDLDAFLKVQIIPADDQGNIGEAIVSKAYMRLDQSS